MMMKPSIDGSSVGWVDVMKPINNGCNISDGLHCIQPILRL
jgi:hypothetical protein